MIMMIPMEAFLALTFINITGAFILVELDQLSREGWGLI